MSRGTLQTNMLQTERTPRLRKTICRSHKLLSHVGLPLSHKHRFGPYCCMKRYKEQKSREIKIYTIFKVSSISYQNFNSTDVEIFEFLERIQINFTFIYWYILFLRHLKYGRLILATSLSYTVMTTLKTLYIHANRIALGGNQT